MNVNKYSKIFKALGDDTRLKIVMYLSNNDNVCACKLLDIVDCVQSTLSHHMKILVDSSIVIAKEEGKWTHYSINKNLFKEIINFLGE